MPTRYIRETYRILEATDPVEYAALNAGDKTTLWRILNMGMVDFHEGSNARTLLYTLFGEGTTTRSNYDNLGKPAHVGGIMTFGIIIKGKDDHHKFGKTRSEQEENMRKEWGYTMTDEQLDKLKFIERKKKEKDGSTKNWIPGHYIDEIT